MISKINFKAELDVHREYRRKHFNLEIKPDPYYDKTFETEQMHVINMTGNGSHWYSMGFYKEEFDILIEKLKEYRATI